MLAAVVCAIVCALGCAGACQDPLAVLKESQGQVQRDFSTRVNAWELAAIGVDFKVGDGIKTGTKSGALLLLEDGSQAGLKSNTLVRFLATPPKSSEQGLDIVTGEATLTVGEKDLGLRTTVGLALLEAGSQVTLRRADEAMRFEVNVGVARFETSTGPIEVKAGNGVEIGIGQAVLERFELGKDQPDKPDKPTLATPETSDTTVPETGDIGLNVEGRGVRLKEPGSNEWTALKAGTRSLNAGSSLSLPRGTSATITRGDRQVVLRGQGQFLVASAGAAFIQTESGGISVSAGSSSVSITVPGGTITTKQGGLSDLNVRRDTSLVNVRVGEVEIKTASGVETLRGGEEAKLSAKGEIDVGGRGPSYADILLSAGDSIAVHDPSPPTAVGIRFGERCTRGGVVQLMRGSGVQSSSRSETGLANILIPPGLHSYQLRCLGPDGLEDKPSAVGRVSVQRDSGTSQLPSSAPRTQVDADGRKYTVLYQNLLPQIAVRWKDAPKAGSYKLTLIAKGKSQAFTTLTPNYFFPSASVPEGTHQLVFEGASRRSRPTTLTISFDNAAPTARITSPADRSFAAGASVTVSGIALPGWKVAVGGQELSMDAQNRFTGSVTTPADLHAFAIRFAHPTRGVRFYLRRAE